ncbi:DMT family transporter [Moraxella bovis]|uniref:EamA-like transporter family n=1 Tax=Moraxella bovis TaxID=476 RepID=A0A378PZV3_MORBO|nr:DMT family transporter [Moraxella bovis]UYZ71783.1 DMT family transporter [Moraxella bovis]UYZ72302.1 DMT family transporter [Moraxella bovis]UZA15080.1 DMT family transporter [Moraxella bovis]UZA38906.1 DMT family transporter [Moraxella bovis]UZA42184.1 DMT family transporter [Moraxella bovis]
MTHLRQLFCQLSPTAQGYVCIVLTMLVWGSFSLLARLNASWGILAWDIIAVRFGVSAGLLLPILIYRQNTAFLWQPKAVILALFGGVGYSSLVYSAFLLAPVVHGAVFLNGMIPVATALLMLLLLKKRPDHDTKIALILIIITLTLMTALMLIKGLSFGVGDVLFVICACCWAGYGIMLKEWGFSPWQVMCSTAIWSAILYLPIYGVLLYLGVGGLGFGSVSLSHAIIQGAFHSVMVMIFATMTYSLAVERLGAFFAGGLASLAPFISALLAVPLLGEPLNSVMVLGLIGMGLGTVQPWRYVGVLKNRLFKSSR